MKKIALEEHFITSDFVKYSEKAFSSFVSKDSQDILNRLLDFDDQRLETMDQAGIEISVLSLTEGGIQSIPDAKSAVPLARQVNDYLAKKIQQHPHRYKGFAALPMQDPKSAADELERCVKDLHFVGGLVNGQTHDHCYDEELFYPFWERVQDLNVPIYLHPGELAEIPKNYEGYSELAGAFWGWTADTATHALRLVISGLFDRFPNLHVILGHMGETLPYLLWRLDSRWNLMQHKKTILKPPSEYLKENFYFTTSGVCDHGSLQCAIDAVGEDRVLFSVDYPYESSSIAAQFIETAPLSPATQEKVCRRNAERLLKLMSEIRVTQS